MRVEKGTRGCTVLMAFSSNEGGDRGYQNGGGDSNEEAGSGDWIGWQRNQ